MNADMLELARRGLAAIQGRPYRDPGMRQQLQAFAELHDRVTGFNPRLPWYGWMDDVRTLEAKLAEARARAADEAANAEREERR